MLGLDMVVDRRTTNVPKVRCWTGGSSIVAATQTGTPMTEEEEDEDDDDDEEWR